MNGAVETNWEEMALIGRLDDENEEARAAAAELSQMARRGRVSLAGMEQVASHGQDARSSNRALAAETMRAALKSGMVLEGTQAELIALLSDRVLEVRYQSALTLRDLCGMRLADEEAVMPLIAAVDDVSVEIATLAAKALPPLFVRFGPVEEARAPLLRGLRAADDGMVRACLRGLLTLSMMGADVDPPREALETLSKSGDYRTRRLAEQLRRRLRLEGRSNG